MKNKIFYYVVCSGFSLLPLISYGDAYFHILNPANSKNLEIQVKAYVANTHCPTYQGSCSQWGQGGFYAYDSTNSNCTISSGEDNPGSTSNVFHATMNGATLISNGCITVSNELGFCSIYYSYKGGESVDVGSPTCSNPSAFNMETPYRTNSNTMILPMAYPSDS